MVLCLVVYSCVGTDTCCSVCLRAPLCMHSCVCLVCSCAPCVSRSLGVILYELFVGQPPFYTNSIYVLITLIINNPVKYAKEMSPHFKAFLEGLLHKTPAKRLAWYNTLTPTNTHTHSHTHVARPLM